ncbi:MAG: hypothetical protein JW795_01550 [Chitinivibrionales bacterium]|nr:hypothetical protein [Chitinivibrionales bacterium]
MSVNILSKKWAFFMIALLVFALAGTTFADSYYHKQTIRYPKWQDHAKHYSFLFGNHIDSHQQSMVLNNNMLWGYLYITFTGEETSDGFPIVQHPDENTPAENRVVGWFFRAVPATATMVYHHMDHPLWLMKSRSDIPQPGSFTHFHWIGAPMMAEELMEGHEYGGYVIELWAVRTFAFKHHEQTVVVRPGLDNATHLNIITSFPGDMPLKTFTP